MPDNNVRFHSVDGKRRVLIVDDETANRDMLSAVLEQDYELMYARTGEDAMRAVRACFDTLSLVLLDLRLPDMNGMDILRMLKENAHLARIPVIVMTSDRDSEVESLTLGASDFISKPYPMPGVIQARVLRTIELSEDRDILRWTERDQLTGLYNREFFYRYAEQFDMFHRDLDMDCIVVDVCHFQMINERYGKAYADEILKRVAKRLQALVAGSEGIVCRREADTFLIYCPHRSDYATMLEAASVRLGDDGPARVRLRMGVYSNADKGIDIERRFDRAKIAADTVRSSFARTVAVYDNALHESEIFAEQLLDDFQAAIDQKQFRVFYQPKFDVRFQEGLLDSAEALVRWKHPTLGLISPGIFIPLFEGNGLIQQLDAYVWREAAAQLRAWKDRLGFAVPVSVNVSRVDMLDPLLVNRITALMAEFGLERGELHLEITESAYTQDAEQIIDTVVRLREAGFVIEMDDFGSGYSSLNMISTLPIDALKLDMMFLRNAFSERKNTRMLEVVFDIARSLDVPTIAEGVETAEQMFSLKAMGCDIVQGYYFSRPLPPEEFEAFLLRRREAAPDTGGATEGRARERSEAHEKFTYDALHDPLTGLYNHSGFEMLLKDADQAHIAVLVADVEGFRAISADAGLADRVILRVAGVLRRSFRSVDLLCRLKKDEFAVIMTRVNSSMRDQVFRKVERLNRELGVEADGVPRVALSVGVAFADRENPQGDLLHDADIALYRMKEVRQCGCAIY